MTTIMIVDDDPLLIDVISHKLRFHGMDVLKVENSPVAVMVAREQKPDAIVLDAMMPGLDGFSVLRELKADPKTMNIPVMMLTAKKMERDVVMALSSGASDYMTKPFSPAEFFSRVNRLLGKKT